MKLHAIARLTACAIAVAALVLAGCESPDEDVDASISISPAGCELGLGKSRAFTAVGGRDYKWSLENKTIGYLSNSTGPTARYTAVAAGTQTITVTATADSIEGGRLVTVKDCEATATVIQSEEKP